MLLIYTLLLFLIKIMILFTYFINIRVWHIHKKIIQKRWVSFNIQWWTHYSSRGRKKGKNLWAGWKRKLLVFFSTLYWKKKENVASTLFFNKLQNSMKCHAISKHSFFFFFNENSQQLTEKLFWKICCILSQKLKHSFFFFQFWCDFSTWIV